MIPLVLGLTGCISKENVNVNQTQILETHDSYVITTPEPIPSSSPIPSVTQLVLAPSPIPTATTIPSTKQTGNLVSCNDQVVVNGKSVNIHLDASTDSLALGRVYRGETYMRIATGCGKETTYSEVTYDELNKMVENKEAKS